LRIIGKTDANPWNFRKGQDLPSDDGYAALHRAKDAAEDRDVRIGGCVATIQQYPRARLVDELHLAFLPSLMGSDENRRHRRRRTRVSLYPTCFH
jgi:dihydrofolate reductase